MWENTPSGKKMIVLATEFMIENILPVCASHPFHQSILRLHFDCVRLRSTFVDVAWHLRWTPRKKRGCGSKGGNGAGQKKREEILFGNHWTPGSGPACVKRFQAAGVFGRGEMKISRRYLSPEKLRPRPYFAGHKSINKERTRVLSKKMWIEQFYLDSISIFFIRNLSTTDDKRTLARAIFA